jgi:hypothetical protein
MSTTQAEQENITRIKRGYDAFAARDISTGPGVMVFTLAGGLVREMREFFADQKTFEAFWA